MTESFWLSGVMALSLTVEAAALGHGHRATIPHVLHQYYVPETLQNTDMGVNGSTASVSGLPITFHNVPPNDAGYWSVILQKI